MAEPTSKPSTKEELEAIFSGPAYAVNRSFITMGAIGVRISFTEQRMLKEGEEGVVPQFRTAVLMSPQDAIALRNLLTGMLSDIEEKIAEAEEKAKAADNG